MTVPWLPKKVEAEREIDKMLAEAEKDGAKCPAAKFGHYVDSRKAFINCLVEAVPGMPATIPVEENMLAVTAFCLGDYTTCPVWRTREDEPEKVERVQRARKRAVAVKERKRQIALGIRVDDDGQEAVLREEALQRADQAVRMEAMHETIERAVQSTHSRLKARKG